MEPPPPATPSESKRVSARVRNGFQALAANEEARRAMQENAETSRYFDGSAPGTRIRRQQVRQHFELFVQVCFGEERADRVWDSHFFIDRTKQFLEGVTNVAQGKFEEKIKTATLWSYKHALYWWASVLVRDFTMIWQRWNTEVSRHIHFLGLEKGLSTKSWKKNNLSDGELVLIFRYICEQRSGLANLKQHWAAMLLVWLTAARPGSIVLSAGYEKGASLGLPGRVRDTGETLYWSDVEFVHMENGIAVRINFRHNKGYRNPHKERSQFSDAKRAFVFLPSMGERLEFDLPIIMFGIAYQRGLFVQSLEDILHQEPSQLFLQKNREVDEQAVFVGVDQSGALTPTIPMRTGALNAKLQELCAAVGLMEHNTYYSLRRTAIIEVRHTHDTEKAKDLAYHAGSANSLFYYDNVGFGDIDMQQFRLGGPQTMSRDEVRKYFSQSNLSRWQSNRDEEALTFKRLLDQKVKEQLPLQREYVAKEQEMRTLYSEVRGKLEELQTNGGIPDSEEIPTGYSRDECTKYKMLLSKYQIQELEKRVQKELSIRKSLYRSIRLRLRNAAREVMQQNHVPAFPGKSRAGTDPSQNSTSARQPGRDSEISGAQEPTTGVITIGDEESDESSSDENANEVNQDADLDSREEPACWANLQAEVRVQVGGDEASAQILETRQQFLKMWVGLKDAVTPSNMVCPRCQIDPTMDIVAKERRFNLYRLDAHMRGDVHTRESQIRRALKQDGYTNGRGSIECPVCNTRNGGGIRAFMKHLKDYHPEQLWEDLDDDATVVENHTNTHDASGNDDEDLMDTDIRMLSSPPPAFKGKGKARAD